MTVSVTSGDPMSSSQAGCVTDPEFYEIPDLQEVRVNITELEYLSDVKAALGDRYDWTEVSITLVTDEDGVTTEWMTLHAVTRKGVNSDLHHCTGCGAAVIGYERCGDPTRRECRP